MSAPSISGSEAGPLLQFVAAMRRRHVRGAIQGALLRVALALALPGIALLWLVPSAAPWLAAGAIGLASFAAIAGAAEARRLSPARLLHGAIGDADCSGARVAELGDELATWIEVHGVGDAPQLLAWLQRDVTARLPQLRATNLAPIGRRRFGGSLWVVPLALLLLLAWLLVQWLSPPWAGALGGGGSAARSGGSGGGAGGGAGDGREATPEQPPERRPLPSPASQPPPPENPAASEPPPSETPPPWLDVPLRRQFLLPEFIGDGPTRRVRMHSAEIDGGQAAPSTVQQRVGESQVEKQAASPREQFERALEQALAARHVPPAERPMVRRFFEGLRQAGR